MIILKMLDIMQLEFVTTINNVYNIYISLSLSTLLKMEFEGGRVLLKFHFKVPFLQSCFLNDQYSSSFHVIGKQMKIKYLPLAPEELNS